MFDSFVKFCGRETMRVTYAPTTGLFIVWKSIQIGPESLGTVTSMRRKTRNEKKISLTLFLQKYAWRSKKKITKEEASKAKRAVHSSKTFKMQTSSTYVRDIPSLSVTVLKEIAKIPAKCVTEAALKRALLVGPKENVESYDLAQMLVDYVTEAGRFTDDVLPPALFKTGRTSLRLKNSKIGGKYIGKVIDNLCDDLIELDVSGTFQVDDPAVAYILEKCKKLQSLNIRNCRKITDKSLDVIIARGPHLVSLDIGGAVNIKEPGLANLVASKKISSLRELNLSGLPLTTESLLILGRSGQRLTSVGLGYTDIGEYALREFIKARGHQLEKLALHWMCTSLSKSDDPDYKQISTEFICDFLSYQCPKLTDLDVSGQKNVNAPSLQQFLDTKKTQSDINPAQWNQMKVLKAKFIGSSRAQVEQIISFTYPNLTLEA